ncbi:serine carboxypeptidase [Cristinia sonorae]|uniref:Serine carboxypeptidase n=1 Tax=Cristinia sonorae TaxID=1940300 RepID=A0A8K0UFI4_9AGAR|nr:serine carboxypeptidase [Cristinia sonorae]
MFSPLIYFAVIACQSLLGLARPQYSAVNTLLARTNGTAPGNSTTTGKLRGVVENSGVCETTPGVYQASGYGDISANESVWFWFFAARKNPETAPLILWLNGGPGSSSMEGIFDVNGPCRINNDSSSVSHNPTSWNEVANIIYVDQPIGVGFSHGVTTVNSTGAAAMDMWKFMQIFFADPRFSKYQKLDFGLWTQSYGGHYGPTFSAYFLQQNAAIANGTVSGTTINLKTLGIGNGLTDGLIQYPGYITYASSNPYHPLVNDSIILGSSLAWSEFLGCKDQITLCRTTGEDALCSLAQQYCNTFILNVLIGTYDYYYVPSERPDPYPADFTEYINSENVTSKIGAEGTWADFSPLVYANFAATGDWVRSAREDLETVINAGVRTLIFAGDAVDALETKFADEYKQQSFANYTVRGESAGLFKNAGTLSYLRVFGAGHEVPAYKFGSLDVGEAALQMFTQTISGQNLTST